MRVEEPQVKYYRFEELLEKDGYLLYTNVGSSMMPLLRERKDIIEITAKRGRCKKYDVVFYKRGDQYILHRIIKVLPNGYVIAGDHNTFKEFDIKDENILGVMTRVIREGKSIYSTDFLYRLYAHLWVDFFSIKVFFLRGKELFSRLCSITSAKLREYLNR